MESIVELSGDAYLRMLGSGQALEELSTMHVHGALWVDFGTSDPMLAGGLSGQPSGALIAPVLAPFFQPLVDAFTTLPTPVIAIGCSPDSDAAAVVDVILSPEEVEFFGESLQRSIVANPFAAAALALHLRSSDRRTVPEGLVAESTTYSLLQSGPEYHRWLAQRRERSSVGSDDDAVLVDRIDNTLLVALNRPQRHNAFSKSMRDALVSALNIPLIDDSIGRVELSGRGASFCSGGDLAEFGTFASTVESHLTRLTRSPAFLLHRLADRTTAQLHGACYGAGIELPAFVADVAAHPDTRFCLPEIGLGLIPGAGGTASLPARIGRHRTALMGLSGSVIDAPTALAWGLVDRLGS